MERSCEVLVDQHKKAFLLRVHFETESECDSTKIGHNKNNTKDYGLMQINSCNLKWISKEFGETDLRDSIQNINVGMTILYDLFQKYDGEPN